MHPPVSEYFHPSIFVNTIATQVTSAVLGPRPKWTSCSANAAMPSLLGARPQRQPVHSDADFAQPTHPFALVVNVPLVSMTPENGSTEVWLGSHTTDATAQEGAHGERVSGRIKEEPEELLDHRRRTDPPAQPVISKGPIVVRDLHLWHAGMPNNTDKVRIMLAMIHFASWYRNPMRLEFGEDVRPILQGLQQEDKLALEIPINCVKREKVLDTYLNRGFGNSYDFDQAP
ncbi:phytanoyl-CoA dioxygenase [Seiridium cupressi]